MSLNPGVCRGASPCSCILNTAWAEEAANGFYGEGLPAVAGGCDAF